MPVLPAILTGVASRVDGSWKLVFETRELVGEEALKVMEQLHQEGHLLFAPNQDAVENIDVPETKADSGLGGKSPSARLRGVLYVFWEQKGKKGSFETFYSSQMEKLIDTVKEKLTDGS